MGEFICIIFNEQIGNCCCNQRKDTLPEMIKLPTSICPTEDGHKAVSRPQAEANVGSQNEGSITTDDSVRRSYH